MTSRLSSLWTAASVALGTGLGIGLSPVAPGTFGSLLGPPLVWLVRTRTPGPESAWIVAGILILLGGPICGRAAAYFHAKDPGHVVYDEIVAFFLVYLFAPVTWFTAVAGFLWFRLFDILKPWPIRHFEKLPGGWGVLADDLVAGLFAAVGLWATIRIWPD